MVLSTIINFEWDDFLSDVAVQVDRLFLNRDNLEKFHQNIRPLAERWEQHYQQQQREYKKRQDTWKKVKANPRLRDRSAGPPEKGYEWDDHYLFGVEGTDLLCIEGEYLLDDPIHEMPAKLGKEYIEAVKTYIKRNEKCKKQHRSKSGDYQRPQETISKQRKAIRIIRSQINNLDSESIETAWVRVPPMWWRYLGIKDNDIFGCWRPQLDKTLEHPVNRLIPPEGSKGLPKPKDREEEYERYYTVLTSIHDNILTGCQRIDEGIWPSKLADQVWGRLSWGQPYGPGVPFIRAALERVKANLDAGKPTDAGQIKSAEKPSEIELIEQIAGELKNEDLVSLPPILPGLEIRTGDDDSGINRIYNLAGRAYSAVVDARNKRFSLRQKGNLMVAFRRECQKALGFVSNRAKSFAGTSPQDHFNFFKDYQCWCKSLEEFVEKSLVDNTVVLGHFLDLSCSQMNLLKEAELLESITTDTMNKAIREGLQKLAAETLSKTDIDKISATIEDIEALKKAKKRYWETCASRQKAWFRKPPPKDRVNHVTYGPWLKNVGPIITKINSDLDELAACIVLCGTGNYSLEGIKFAVESYTNDLRESKVLDAVIREFEMIRQNLQVKEQRRKGDIKTKAKKRRKRKIKLTSEQKDIYDRIENGTTVAELAAEKGCSVTNIRQQYRKAEEKLKQLNAGSRSINLRKTQRLPTDRRGQETVEDKE